MESTQNFWRKCSSCKKPIPFNTKYYECSVSTCTGQRTGYVFCTVDCWENHLPGARHRDAAAVEKKSGSAPVDVPPDPKSEPVRRIIVSGTQTTALTRNTSYQPQIPRETLIVVSKLKDYIKARADMNTSGDVIEVLSDKVRHLCDDAIDSARADGRKTVMERDFKKN